MRPILIASASALILAAIAAAAPRAAPADGPLVFYGSQSGRPTLDQGEGGGNPFASALISLLEQPELTLGELPDALHRETDVKSDGFQDADVVAAPPALTDWPINADDDGALRLALVIVVSDYSASDQAPSLPGAARDARRVAAALSEAGWHVQTVLDPDREGFHAALAAFAAHSVAADGALIYTTGHGVEADGEVHVILGDVPVAQGEAALDGHAIRLAEIAAAPAAKRVNLVFYAGCRDNPLAAADAAFTAPVDE